MAYLNYGNLLVDEQALLVDLSNNFVSDVNKLSVSRKKKEAILAAGLDMINRGIRGATPTGTGWNIDIGGTPITDAKLRDIYGYAADLIEKRMRKLAVTPKEEKEEEEKKELPKFEGTHNEIIHRIGLDTFGGNDFKASEWREYYESPRGKNGLYGISGRRKELARQLELYKDDLPNNPVDFTGSAFKDLADYQSKLNNTIAILKDENIGEQELKRSLASIGLKYDDWFSNGSGDPYVDENGYNHINQVTQKPYTYAEWYNYLNQLQNLKLEEELKAAEEKLKALDAIKVYTSKGRKNIISLEDIANKPEYKGDLNNVINTYKGKSLLSLTLEENDELVSLFQLGHDSRNALDLISDLDWELIKSKFPGVQDSDRNIFRKIKGLDNIFYNINNKNLFLFDNGTLTENSGSRNFLLGLSDKDKNEINLLAQLKYLLNTEWTADLWRELGGIAADVISVVDPEPVSAGISALAGTGLRTWNRFTDEDGFTLSDIGHTALDAGLSLLGMIPVVGDAALAARVIGKLQKAAGWMGTIFSATSVPQAAKAAWDKVVNGKDLTVDDWRAIGNVFMGLTLARRILLNRAAGNAVKNSTGKTTTEKVSEVEVKIGDNIEKVQISELAAKELKANYQKAGNNLEETSKALKKSREVRSELEAKKGSDRKPLYTKELLDAIEAPQAAAGSITGRNPFISRRPTRGITSSTRAVLVEGVPITENSPLRVQYAANNLGFFGRGNYGWNINGKTGNESKSWLRRQWDNLVHPYEVKPSKVESRSPETPTAEAKPATPSTTQVSYVPEGISKIDSQIFNKALGRNNNYRLTGETPLPNPKLNGTTLPLIDGSTYKLSFDGNKTFTVEYNGVKTPITGKTLLEAKVNLGKEIDKINSKLKIPENFTKDNKEWQNMLSSIKKLKREGYFMKQGGKITDTQIENFLKQYRV